MKKFAQIEMEVERVDEGGNILGVFNVLVEGKLYEESGDWLNPPISEIDIVSVMDENGVEHSLSTDEEERAMELLWNELVDKN